MYISLICRQSNKGLTSKKLYVLKVPGPISQNGEFYSNDAPSPKKSWFKLSFKSVIPFGYNKRLCILQLPIPHCASLIMFTITSHIFINIFQTVHFPALKFTRGNEKNTSFLLIPNLWKFEKNLKWSDWAPLKLPHIFWMYPLYLANFRLLLISPLYFWLI